MRSKRRAFEVFNLSFLDVVSCGFGAIVLLLVIVKIAEPLVVTNTTTAIETEITELQNSNKILFEQSTLISGKLQQASVVKEQLEKSIFQLKSAYTLQKKREQEAIVSAASGEAIIVQLHRARQELTEEMRRLQQKSKQKSPNSIIGGVPVDSEYIIFVIDTSGSMQKFAWKAVRQKMAEILEIYPEVKGIQVMNDMGDYMFSQYSGRWIRDSPARRKAILERLASWTPFSNSSPVEGITAAIKRFYAADKKISIYVFGDDFSRGSIQEVVDTVRTYNSNALHSSRRVRIHAVGFPVLFKQPGAELNVVRFSALMRRLAEDNDGSFVGLTKLQ